MEMIMLLGILCLTIPSFARWSNPIEVLHSYSANFTSSRSVYTDESVGTSHILWYQTNTSTFCYRRFYSNETLTPIVCFNWKPASKSSYMITGTGNGKSIYIIYQSPRDGLGKGNCSTNSMSCNDIYFSESSNGGESWLEPISVPRRYMNDNEDRIDPKFLISKNERIWIFYRKSKMNDAPCAYVTRSSGSSSFRSEIVLNINVSSSISVVYNANMGKEFVSIYYYSYKQRSTLRYYTTNFGISWNGPVIINYCEGQTIYTLPYNSYRSAAYLFAVCRSGDYVDSMIESVDFGKSWETIEMPFATYRDKLTASGDGKTYGFVAYADHLVHYLKFSDTTFRTIIKPPTPRKKDCVILTSTYKYTKFWFWYEVTNADNTYSLWVTYIEMTEDMIEN